MALAFANRVSAPRIREIQKYLFFATAGSCSFMGTVLWGLLETSSMPTISLQVKPGIRIRTPEITPRMIPVTVQPKFS